MPEPSRNPNIISASLEFDSSGLLNVSFVCRGVMEYPTSLKEGASLYDEPIYAFRGGEASSKLLPQYSYLRNNSPEKSFICTTLLLQDGSPYIPSEPDREITERDKMRVFDCSCDTDELGLLHVKFSGVGLVGNKPIYPTSLASGKSISEKTVDAFWGGEKSITLSAQFNRTDERVGNIWQTESILKADGSSIQDGDLVAEFNDYIDYPHPGRVDVTQAFGIQTQPGGEEKTLVKRSIYLNKNTVEFSGSPLCIKMYAMAGYYANLGELGAKADTASCGGCLAGSASAGNNGTFAGVDCVGFDSFVDSSISYDAWVQEFKSGRLLECSARLFVVDSEGNKWYLRQEIRKV